MCEKSFLVIENKNFFWLLLKFASLLPWQFEDLPSRKSENTNFSGPQIGKSYLPDMGVRNTQL
jgi:hypothetical protein